MVTDSEMGERVEVMREASSNEIVEELLDAILGTVTMTQTSNSNMLRYEEDAQEGEIFKNYSQEDVESRRTQENDENMLISMEKNSFSEIENLLRIKQDADIKIKEHQQIIQICQAKKEAAKHVFSKRDYMFGIIQKIFNLFLPKMYAIYGTILLNWILSLTNAISDLSVFWWLYGQQHTNQAYIVLGIIINMFFYPVFSLTYFRY